MRVGLADFSLCVDLVDGEVTGPVKVEIRIERLSVETIDGGGILLWDMAISHRLANDSAVLAFGQCVVIGLSRSRLGEFDP